MPGWSKVSFIQRREGEGRGERGTREGGELVMERWKSVYSTAADAKYYAKTMAAPNPKVWSSFLAIVMKV